LLTITWLAGWWIFKCLWHDWNVYVYSYKHLKKTFPFTCYQWHCNLEISVLTVNWICTIFEWVG
jgi:hypothetical protein